MGATQVVEPVVEPEAPPQRGSALAAVAIMAGIALVAAALVVAWARFGGGSDTSAEPDIIDAEPPVSLAGATEFGEVPPAIAAAVEAPVVGAVRLERLPADLEGCGDDFGLTDARLESAIITPDAAVVAVVGSSEEFGFADEAVPLPAPASPPAPPEAAPDEAASDEAAAEGGVAVAAVGQVPAPDPSASQGPQVRASCAASWDGGWNVTSANAGPVGEVFSSTGGVGLPDGRLLNLGNLLVPDGATWLIHDRGGYRLAYPVAGLSTVTVTVPQPGAGPFGPGSTSTSALFLDDTGTVLEETFVGG